LATREYGAGLPRAGAVSPDLCTLTTYQTKRVQECIRGVQGSVTMCEGPHDFITAEEVAKVQLYFSTPGGVAMNVLNFRTDGGWNSVSLEVLIDEIATAWEAQFSPLQSDQVECYRIVATDISTEAGAQVDKAPENDLTGGRSSAVMPNNVTVVTKFGSGLSGRSNRGRTYHIGLVDDQCAGDRLQAGMADTIRDAWIDFAGLVHDSPAAADLVIVSYCFNKAWRTNASVHAVTAFTTEDVLDSQRKRLLGRGM